MNLDLLLNLKACILLSIENFIGFFKYFEARYNNFKMNKYPR